MKLYDRVKLLLERYPQLRDSDRLLIWNVWGAEGLIKDGSITRSDFLIAPHMESIRRVRQKIQEQYPQLQSSPGVAQAKKLKAKKKGTFIYQETVEGMGKPIGRWDYSTGLARWIKEE